MPLFGARKPKLRIGNPATVSQRYNKLPSEEALTASGARVTPQDSYIYRRLIQPWQLRAFSYYDQIPEIKYAAQFYSRLLSPLRLFAAEYDENGDLVETENEEVKTALDRIQDPGGGRTGLLSTYGRLMFLAGECILFVTNDPDTDLEQWEMLSTDELRIMGEGEYTRFKAPSLVAETFEDPDADLSAEEAWVPVDDDEAVAYRLWQRHPRYSMLADSTMMGVLDICEELLLLTRAVRARARSRLAGTGLLLFDDRVSPVPAEAVPDEDPQEDPFLSELTEAMTAPIVDEGTAAAVVPLTLRVSVPGETLKVSDLIHHLQIVDPTQIYPETGLRMECVKRLAIGLDMPPEELLGMTDANHWTAWMVDEQTWKAHGQPKAQQLCDDLTSAYFRPYLREVAKLSDWMNYCVGYDASAIINHPDRTKDAKDLYADRAIGKKALRATAGFDEEDAPTEQELAEMVGIAVRDSSLAWYGIPAPRGGTIEPQAGEIVSADKTGGGSAGTPEGASTGGEVEKGPPTGGPQETTDETVVGSLAARIVGASDLALFRAREAAGNRLRSLAKSDPELSKLIDGVRAMDVAPILGREAVRSLRVSERDLVASAQPLIMDCFRMFQVNESIASVIADTVAQHAARTLYSKHVTALPDTFGPYVFQLLVRANGSAVAG